LVKTNGNSIFFTHLKKGAIKLPPSELPPSELPPSELPPSELPPSLDGG